MPRAQSRRSTPTSPLATPRPLAHPAPTTGLYFYRARYYSPTVQRFISEDPIEFNGGIHLYANVIGSIRGRRGICRRGEGRKEMVDLRQVSWLKYLIVPIVGVIVAYVLPSPTWANSPGRVLVRVAIIAAGFGIIPVVYRIWPPSEPARVSTRRFVAFFLLFVVVLLALGLLGPKLFSLLEKVGLGGIIGRLVEAGGGWLLPLLFLGVFIAFMLLRRRRAA